MSIGATVTPPTYGSIVDNVVYYRQLGLKEYEVIYKFYQLTAGSAGSGSYLWTLPAGLTFNTTLPFQGVYTGTSGATIGFLAQPLLAGPSVGYITDGVNGSQQFLPLVYDATRFRMVANYNLTTWGMVGSGYFFLSTNSAFTFRFQFTAA
jgi:hypothetical protein